MRGKLGDLAGGKKEKGGKKGKRAHDSEAHDGD
jgi:hypothetical protein